MDCRRPRRMADLAQIYQVSTIPVSKAGRYGAEQRTQWGSGPLPTAYPWSNAFATLSDSARVLAGSNMPGTQTSDPRASVGYGTASHVIIPSNEEMFHRVSSVGGDYYAGGIFTSRNIIGWLIAGLVSFLLWKFIKKG